MTRCLVSGSIRKAAPVCSISPRVVSRVRQKKNDLITVTNDCVVVIKRRKIRHNSDLKSVPFFTLTDKKKTEKGDGKQVHRFSHCLLPVDWDAIGPGSRIFVMRDIRLYMRLASHMCTNLIKMTKSGKAEKKTCDAKFPAKVIKLKRWSHA